MGEMIFRLIMAVACCWFVGYDCCVAARSYNERRYERFGTYVALALAMAICMVKHMFGL